MAKGVPLEDLRSWAEARGLDDALSRPLDEVIPELRLSPGHRKLLVEFAEWSGLSRLGQILTSEVEEVLLARSRAAFLSIAQAVWEHLHRMAPDPRAPNLAIMTTKPSPAPIASEVALATSRGGDALRAWAGSNGLRPLLDAPVQILTRYAGIGRTIAMLARNHVTVDQLLTQLSVVPHGATRKEIDELKQAALRLLHDGLINVQMARLRQLELSRRAVEPIEPAVVAFVERLRAVRAESVKKTPERALCEFHPCPVRFVSSPPSLVYAEKFTERAPKPSCEAMLPLDPAALGTALRQMHASRDPAWVAALDAFIDVARDPAAPAHEELVKWFTTPPWERLLSVLDSLQAGLDNAARAAGPAQRLAWRMRLEPTPEIVPLLQLPRAGGDYTPGAALSPEQAASLLAQGELLGEAGDEAALAALSRSDRGSSRRTKPEDGYWRLTRVLEQLVGHPRVFLGTRASSTAMRVARSTAALRFEPAPDGTTKVMFALESRKLSPADLLSAAMGMAELVLVDAELREILLVRLDEPTLALAHVLASVEATFPVEAQRELARRIHRMAPSLRLDIPEELMGRSVPADRTLVVRLTPLAGVALDVTLCARPLPNITLAPGQGEPRVMGTLDGEPVVTTRDLEDELARAERLRDELGLGAARHLDEHHYRIDEQELALELLEKIEARAGELTIEWPEGEARPRVEGTARTAKMRVRVKSAREWFELEGEVEVGDATVALGALLQAVRSGARYVQIGQRRFARIADDLREKLGGVADSLQETRSRLEFSLAALPAMDLLLDGVQEADLAEDFTKLRGRMLRASKTEPKLPRGLKAELRPYQRAGVQWMQRLRGWGVGACLADDMGLGKTLQALALLLDAAKEGPSLVIAPTSVVGNWVREAERFAPGLEIIVLRGADRHGRLEAAAAKQVYITSYDLMARDAEALAGRRFAVVIFDEAQALKNPATRRARAARSIDAGFRLALTGTPIENHIGDLWSLYRIVVPGLLGSAEQFRDRFVGPIDRGQDARARTQALARLVRPFLLRRTKAEVAPELPPRTEIVQEIELSAPERALYEACRREALATLDGGVDGGDQRFAVLAAMTRLRRLACHPRLVDEGSAVASSKLAAFMELARELRDAGRRALVFSQFTTHLALVRQALEAEGFTLLELDGSTPAEQRQGRVDAFQAGEADIFLISLKAGGSGLNLTAAETVIHLDPWWNPAAEDQATDRAHRIGQTRPVTVIRLVARGTIEQAVIALHQTKRDLAQSLLEGADVAAKLSSEELLSLFRGSEEPAEA